MLGPIGTEVAWYVAMRSLPCHMQYSYLGIEPRTSQKEVPQPPRVQTTRIAEHS